MTTSRPWWKGGIIYQIYPRSFMDSNGDGIGDLRGITSKLDYVASLGVDGIWLSPFFTSPMQDFGYDVADYCDVDPMFGNLDDFKGLVERAHQLDLKVVIDQVLSHCSDQHAWFQESRTSRDNPKADWFVWADGKEGRPPNNWLSIFGGSAWQWEPQRQQFYLHNFLVSQPDLNFHCPEVRQAHLDNMRFWLEIGVDGFRFDVVSLYYHHPSLKDNPARTDDDPVNPGIPADNPHSLQRHLYECSQPENLEYLAQIRQLLDEYGATTSIGEIFDDEPLKIMAQYTRDQRLHMAYSFDFLRDEHRAEDIRQIINTTETIIAEGWPCWAFSNHDVKRVVSRWGDERHGADFALAAMALLLSLRGSVCIYQGEELGLPEADVPFEALQDPYGKTMWPKFKGRDGCRTPFPWDSDAPHAGFSEHESWLMVSPEHLPLAVSRQTGNASTLERMRRLIHWRQQQPALLDGSIEVLEGTGELIGLVRRHAEQSLLVLVNLTGQTRQTRLPWEALHTCTESGFDVAMHGNQVHLPAYQAVFFTLD